MKAIPFNVEDELSTAIEAMGGKRVSEILGRAPGHENADFFFPASSVIAELKCLEEDKIYDSKIIEKASQLYKRELLARRAPIYVRGTAKLTTRGFSKEFHDKIGQLYRVPVERLVRKADRQIGQTAQALKVARPIGLLLIANNKHSALDPQHVWFLVHNILAQPKYGSIDGAVVFSGNLGAAAPRSSERIDYWVEVQRPDRAQIAPEFFGSLRKAWHLRLAQVFGVADPPTAVPADANAFESLASDAQARLPS